MFRQLKYQYENSNMLMKVIAVNGLVFLLINAVYIPLNLFKVEDFYAPGSALYKAVYWLSVPADLKLLLFRPWTIITYMFLHQDFWHIVFNMLMLYFSGRIFCDLLSDKRFLPTYLFGGIAGMLFFVLGYNIFPKLYITQGAFMLGASASVMSVFVATATYFPTYEVYLFGVFRVQLRWLAILYVVSDFVALGGASNLGGHLAHLGGAFYGFIYARQLANGNDLSLIFYRFTDGVVNLFRQRPHIKVAHRNTGSSTFRNMGAQQKSKQKSIDEILDKISRSGYESLNKEEKDTLFKASRDQ